MSGGREKLSKAFAIVFYASSVTIFLGTAASLWQVGWRPENLGSSEIGQRIGGLMALLTFVAFGSFLIVCACQIGIWTDWFSTGRAHGEKRPQLSVVFLVFAAMLALWMTPVASVDINVDFPQSSPPPQN